MTYAPATGRLPTRAKASARFLALLTLAFANETFDWRLVGNYDREVIVALPPLWSGLLRLRDALRPPS